MGQANLWRSFKESMMLDKCVQCCGLARIEYESERIMRACKELIVEKEAKDTNAAQ